MKTPERRPKLTIKKQNNAIGLFTLINERMYLIPSTLLILPHLLTITLTH